MNLIEVNISLETILIKSNSVFQTRSNILYYRNVTWKIFISGNPFPRVSRLEHLSLT